MHELTENNTCRLAKALIERYGITYEEAMYRLANFRLALVCDRTIANSAAMQAALITAINAGTRAFHGGVYVTIPESIPTRIPWPGHPILSGLCASLGAHLAKPSKLKMTQIIYFYAPESAGADDLMVSAAGWRGGVSPADSPVIISSPVDFSLGGVFAGAVAVARGFLRIAGIDTHRRSVITGASLWDLEADWTQDSSEGPELRYLPQKLWHLGLGHLGQAYIWNLGLLPYAEPEKTFFMLQDFDRIVYANLGTGLLCNEQSINKLKTRICAGWLEQRRFQTTIVERPFDVHVTPNEDEPFVALCAFDSAAARKILETPGFNLVIEAGIGGELWNFDQIFLHTFPDATKKPNEIWSEEPRVQITPQVVGAFHPNQKCGVMAETLAGKAVATAFIGTIAGAFVVAEVLRGLHGGERSEFLRFHVRRDSRPTVVRLSEKYQLRFARSGYTLGQNLSLSNPARLRGRAFTDFRRRRPSPRWYGGGV